MLMSLGEKLGWMKVGGTGLRLVEHFQRMRVTRLPKGQYIQERMVDRRA